jgi:hypothetical protein
VSVKVRLVTLVSCVVRNTSLRYTVFCPLRRLSSVTINFPYGFPLLESQISGCVSECNYPRIERGIDGARQPVLAPFEVCLLLLDSGLILWVIPIALCVTVCAKLIQFTF